MQTFFILALYILSALFIAVLCLNVYVDICQVKVLKRQKKIQKLKTTIGIVIVCRNNQTAIEMLLRQCSAARLPSVKVVIIDNKSSDQSPQIIKRFLKQRGTFRATTIFKTKAEAHDKVLAQAAKKIKGCSYIIELSGGTQLEKAAIKNLRQFIEIEQPALPVAVPTYPNYQDSLSGLWLMLAHISKNILLRSYALIGVKVYTSTGSAIYPSRQLQKKSAAVYSTQLYMFPPLLRAELGKKPGLVSYILLSTWTLVCLYSVYVMLLLQTNSPFLLTFLLFFAWNVTVTTYITAINIKQKIIQSFLSPLLYMLTSIFWPLLLHIKQPNIVYKTSNLP